jgi:hypothetical protein
LIFPSEIISSRYLIENPSLEGQVRTISLFAIAGVSRDLGAHPLFDLLQLLIVGVDRRAVTIHQYRAAAM